MRTVTSPAWWPAPPAPKEVPEPTVIASAIYEARTIPKAELQHIYAVLSLAAGLTKRTLRLAYRRHIITHHVGKHVIIDNLRFESLEALDLWSRKL